MPELVVPLVAILAGYLYAILVWPLLTRGRALLAVLAVLPLFAAPLLVPAAQLQGRACVSFFCTALVFKIIDYAREMRQATTVQFSSYFCFLSPLPLLM